MRISFNVNRLIEMLIPELLRKPKNFGFLKAAYKPVSTLYAVFLVFRDEKLYEATITGETNRLEKAMQDKYNNAGIYFVQPLDYLDEAWIFTENEPHFEEFDYLESEDHQPAEYDYLESEFDPEYDFIVRVPVALIAFKADIENFLKKYVMAGKRYKIELY